MKRFLAFLLPLLISIGTYASVRTPKDDRGFTVPSIDLVGADGCNLDAAVTTTPIVCSSGSVIVYGLVASNAAIGDFATFRSTNLAAASIVSTSAIVYVSTQMWSPSGGNAGTGASFVFKFPVPLKMTNGLNVKLNATVGTAGVWTILYRKQSATE